jgi:hypothetical protein
MNGLTLVVQSPPGVEPEERLIGELPWGVRGTEATVAAMTGVIREAAKGARVQSLARVLSASPPTTESFPAKVFRWLRTSIRFHKDPPGLEFLRHPERIIAASVQAVGTPQKPLGDCDDVADLCGALLLAAGFRPVLVVVATAPTGPYVHVYGGFRQGEHYVPLDPQELAAPGIEVTAAQRRVFDVAP